MALRPVRHGCSVFLSLSGLASELGAGYPQSRLAARYHRLAPAAARKHHVHQPVCLYGLEDARALALAAELRVVDVRHSAFHNVKLHAVAA